MYNWQQTVKYSGLSQPSNAVLLKIVNTPQFHYTLLSVRPQLSSIVSSSALFLTEYENIIIMVIGVTLLSFIHDLRIYCYSPHTHCSMCEYIMFDKWPISKQDNILHSVTHPNPLSQCPAVHQNSWPMLLLYVWLLQLHHLSHIICCPATQQLNCQSNIFGIILESGKFLPSPGSKKKNEQFATTILLHYKMQGNHHLWCYWQWGLYQTWTFPYSVC